MVQSRKSFVTSEKKKIMDNSDERHSGISFTVRPIGAYTLRIGMRIDIKRSDGRVHSAYVAGINYENRSATVEWFEDGETKGKEVDLAAIQALNPDIIVKSTQKPTCEEQPSARESNLKCQRNSTSAAICASRSSMPTSRRPARENSKPGRPSPSDGNFTRPNSGITLVPSYNDVTHTRTSQVVKEVERLKKNREERRQRLAEEKAEKKALNQTAPNNPHRALMGMIAEFRQSLNIKPLTDHDTIENHLITVCVRKRPLNKMEMSRNEVDVITIPSKNQLILHEPKNKVDMTKYMENQMFRFDYAFDECSTNEFVYKYTAQPLVKSIFEGGFSTCFAYGQTGSGKTHTMGGNFIGKNQDCLKGIYAMATADIFKLARLEKYRKLNVSISASFFEIYSGKLFDLLSNKAKLKVLEDGKQQVQIVGLTEKAVTSPDEVLKLIQQGSTARTSGQTAVNLSSSRSHAVFQIILRINKKLHGKLSLIDLAGNERGADTSSINRQTRMEGAEINKSLLALKECIRAMGRKKAHLPFRVSKLTQVLRDSFVGVNSRTCMIAMISPGVSSCEQSLNTLRYANRVKELTVEDPQNDQVEEDSDRCDDDNDLKQLQSANDQEITPHLFNFHKMVSELQVAEDKMIESQRATVDHLISIGERGKKLIKMTDVVDFNPEEYIVAWEKLLSTSITVLTRAKAVIFDFKAKLAKEEQFSRTQLN